MKLVWLVPAVLAAAAPALAQDVAAGRKAFARCANCHGAPDLSLRWDRVWLDSINRSA